MQKLVNQVAAGIVLFESKYTPQTLSTCYVMFAMLQLFTSFVIVKLTNNVLPTSQFLMIRGIFEFLTNSATDDYAFNSSLTKLPLSSLNMIILRNLFANFKFFVMQFLIYKVPLSELTVVDLSSTYVTGLMDYLVNGTKYHLYEAVSAVFSTVGVLLIVNPEIIGFTTDVVPEVRVSQYNYAHGFEKMIYYIIFFISVITGAFSMIVIKKLKKVNPFALNVASGPVLIFYGALGQIFLGDFKVPPIEYVIGAFLIGGMIGYCSKACFVRGTQLGKPGRVIVLTTMLVVYSNLFDIFYLGEIPPLTTFAGTLIILVSTIYLALKK